MSKYSVYEERFEPKMIPEPNSGCWLWVGGQQKSGYGAFRFLNKQCCAHRVSWTLYRGEIPDGLCVLHKCDNRQCVNPDHLFLGTLKDNMQDMARKGRAPNPIWARGENNGGGGKLTESNVREIRTAHGLHREIAETFGVSRPLVSAIKRGDVWKDA